MLEIPDEDGLVAAEGEAPAQPIRGENWCHVTRCRAPIGHLVSRCRSTMSSCTGSRLIRLGWVHRDGAGHRCSAVITDSSYSHYYEAFTCGLWAIVLC